MVGRAAVAGRSARHRPLRLPRARDRRSAGVHRGCERDLRSPDRAVRRRGSIPPRLLADDPETLRLAAGLSHAKLRYLRALATEIVDGRLDLAALDALPDDEVVTRLTGVTGIGPWVASLFLMFELDRPDVVAAGDLAIRQAIRRSYALDAVPTIAEVTVIAESWRPHRTLACEFLWRSLRTQPV